MSLYLYARKTTVSESVETTEDLVLRLYTAGDDESVILGFFLARARMLDNITQCVVTTDEGGSEVDLKVYDYYEHNGQRQVLIPSYYLVARDADWNQDWEYSATHEPAYKDTSGGAGDAATFPGHVVQYIGVYNSGGGAIAIGQLLSYESNNSDERHWVEVRGSGKTTEPPAGVALDVIAVGSWGRMGVGGYCDVQTSDDRSDTGSALFASNGSGTEDEASGTATTWVVGTAVGGIGSSYYSGWARVALSLGYAVDTTAIAHSATTGKTANDHHNEAHTVASHSDTTATGANLNELVGAGITALHKHKHRHPVDFGQRNTVGNDYWDTYTLVSGVAGYRATTLNRAGSVVEFSFTFNMNAVTTPGNFECEIYVGQLAASATMIKEEVVAISATGYVQVSQTYTPGTYTFSANDMIALYGRLAGGLAGTWRDGVARVIVEYDT